MMVPDAGIFTPSPANAEAEVFRQRTQYIPKPDLLAFVFRYRAMSRPQ
jgi:hypothetical protein